jgi:hypothetical protein
LNKKEEKKKEKKMISDKERKNRLRKYKESQKVYLLTSRFTNETWEENKAFKRENRISCVYCSPDPIRQNIPVNSILLILEMNNNTNKIMGIGMVKNHPICNKYKVYKKENYNRYVYMGKNRIDRVEMNEEEEEIMNIFDILCFKGNKHMKRSRGLKSFPIDMLYKIFEGVEVDLIKRISEMFKIRIMT